MSRKRTLLLVDDDHDLRTTLAEQFELTGEFDTVMAQDAASGVAAARTKGPDLILLDIDLPDLDGREACKAIRTGGFAGPIIMLTGQSTDSDTVLGLDAGANDYVTKPFSPKEVVLRVQGLLRRIRSAAEEMNLLEVDGISIDKIALRASADDHRLDLTTIEFKLLLTLVTNRGRILSRETLLSDVWGYSTGADTRTVDTHMRRLREKLGDHAAKVETIRGQGYRFSASNTSSL
jgi:two-component system phosphate regulon response regulator PhoB